MASPSSYTIVTLTAAQQKAAAAAAARRKRRKVLRSQSPHRFQKRLKTCPPVPQQGGAKRPLTSATILSTPTPKTTTSPRTANMIQPTVQGIHQVALELSGGQVLALPTECTYEAVTQLAWNEPNDWADRIQPLYQVMTTTRANNKLAHEEEYNMLTTCDGLSSSSSSSSTNNQNTDDNVNHGKSKEMKDTTTTSYDKSRVDDTTSCTRGNNHHSIRSAPHIFLHMAALDVHPFWRKCLPKRPYAVRNKEGEVLAAHAFNETAAVLKLLAAKMWPGPVVMHVAVDDDHAGKGLTVQRNGKDYVALRSLCHPLMVKVYQEYLKKTSLVTCSSSSSSSSSATATTSVGGIPEDEQEHQQPPPQSPPPPPGSDSSAGGGRDSPLTPNTKARRLSLQQSQHLLVGTPLAVEQQQFVTMATQVVPTGTMVLHGEERREIFAVPTCEYGCPSPISLWLDATERVVVVRRHGRGGKDEGDHATAESCNHVQWTAQHLLQTLRSSLFGLGKTGQDRVIQAVVSRWQVKEEEEEEKP